MRDVDIAWLAGLFEGEGCMSIGSNDGTRLTIRMTDRDVIERVNAMFPATRIQVVDPKPAMAGYSQPKRQYAWRISDPATVAYIIELLLPYFGERRSTRAREVLHHLATRPGTGSFQRNKTHCAKGHEYTPENTALGRDGHGAYRRCRICLREWSRDYRTRHKTA